jgi:thioredoxin 1
MKKISLLFVALLVMPISTFLVFSKNKSADNVIYLHDQKKEFRSSEAHLKKFSNAGNVVIDFYADWCGPCTRMSPVIDEVASTTPNITFIKINRDYFLDLASLFHITSIPTLIFLQDGKEIGRYDQGPLTPKKLSRLISETFNIA